MYAKVATLYNELVHPQQISKYPLPGPHGKCCAVLFFVGILARVRTHDAHVRGNIWGVGIQHQISADFRVYSVAENYGEVDLYNI